MVLHDAGVFERYRAFRMTHTRGVDAARRVVEAAIEKFRGRHPLYYINVLPARAWLEIKIDGHYSRETEDGLDWLSVHDLQGKRAIWTAQGFLV